MIRIEHQALNSMIKDAESTFPDECCGFILGQEEDNDRFVSEILIVNNAKEGDRTRRFEIMAKDYIKAEALADEKGLRLLGVYHSHPNHPALPSEQDRVAAQPYFSYIILSIMNKTFDDIRSWQLNDTYQFEEELIETNVTS
jgi:proteasome lid subunit RPN8/RPN11